MRQKKAKPCKLICWSLQKDGQVRPMICPECGEPAEVGYDMIGRACYFHKRTPSFPFKKKSAKSATERSTT